MRGQHLGYFISRWSFSIHANFKGIRLAKLTQQQQQATWLPRPWIHSGRPKVIAPCDLTLRRSYFIFHHTVHTSFSIDLLRLFIQLIQLWNVSDFGWFEAVANRGFNVVIVNYIAWLGFSILLYIQRSAGLKFLFDYISRFYWSLKIDGPCRKERLSWFPCRKWESMANGDTCRRTA